MVTTNFYPISLNLQDKHCVIVGGGKIALRKIQGLLRCGALVKVIAPNVELELEHYSKEHLLTWVQANYSGVDDLKGASLIFATTNNFKLNEQIQLDANSLGIFVNVASDAYLGDFITPATFSKGDLQVSVSTSGKVPGLSKLIKENLEAQFIPEYKDLIGILEQVRQTAIANPTPEAENLGVLADIIKDYPSILKDLTSGVHHNTITKKLLDKVK